MKEDGKQIDAKLKEAGYKFLGWQNGWATNPHTKDEKGFPVFGGYKDQPIYQVCRDAKHPLHEVQHNQRGSENTVSCDICKIYWKYDCSD